MFWYGSTGTRARAPPRRAAPAPRARVCMWGAPWTDTGRVGSRAPPPESRVQRAGHTLTVTLTLTVTQRRAGG